MDTGIREMQPGEQERVIDYFLNAGPDLLHVMGVDPDRLPDHKTWDALIRDDFGTPLRQRKFYYLFW